MHITVFSWRDIQNPRSGGAERVTFEHMRRWAAAGEEVTLFTAGYSAASPEADLHGVRIVRRGTERSVFLEARRWYCGLRKRPDVVIDEIHGLPFYLLAYARVPVIGWIYEVAKDVWFRMYPVPVAAAGRLLEASSLRWYGRSAVPFITDSRSTAEDLTRLGVRPDLTTVIEPAIDFRPLVRPTQKSSEPTLIYLGRLVKTKAVEDAIRALAFVRKQFPRARLWVVGHGDDDYGLELRRLTNHLGLDDGVIFLGRLNEEDKRLRLADAHVLVHPSHREGWGINVIEANASGTPAVAYSVPGLRDSILHDRTGVLCSRRRPEDLADAIIALLANPARYARLQGEALVWSRRFSWDDAANRSLDLIRRAWK